MKMYDTEWSPDAQDDIDLLWEWIYEESRSLDVADDFVEGLINYTEKSCCYPKNGSLVAAISNASYREIYYRDYTIVYEIIDIETKVVVHEVYNQKRIHIRSYQR